MAKRRELVDWLFVLLLALAFTAILLWLTSITQGIDLLWEEWIGLPLFVTFIISLLGVLIIDDLLNGEIKK